MGPDESDRDDRTVEAMAEFLAALEAGRPPDRAAYLAAHADVAADLGPLLDQVESLHGAGRQVGADAVDVSAAPAFERHARVGKFEILRVLGRGGMGVVYEAVQEPLGRRVALKVLPADAAVDPRGRRRFLHEARVASLLQHPHVVPVYEVGEDAGVQFYAMAYVDGRSLDAVLRTLRGRAGLAADDAGGPPSDAGLLATGLTAGFPVSPDAAQAPPPGAAGTGHPGYLTRVVGLAADAASALAYTHEAGVLHRDVKPGNLILDVRGRVWLSDFGLAKSQDPGADATTARVGTVRYMSPEQAAGRGGVDARTDVYALGLTLYELLTLRPAFSAATDAELLRLITTADPVGVRLLNPAVPVDLETVVEKATAKDPADRYGTAAEFAADLGRFLTGRPMAARRLTRVQRGWRWARRHRRQLAAAGAAVAAGLILGLGLSTYFVWAAYRDAESRREQLAVREGELLALVDQVNRSELVLKDLPGAQAEQRELVLRVKAALGRLADEPGASARVREAAYTACRRVIDVEDRRGDHPAANAAAREARDRLAGLTRDASRTRAERLADARSARELANTFLMVGDAAAAADLYRSALALLEALEAEAGGQPDVLNELGQARLGVAEHLSVQGESGEAVALGRRGLAVYEALARRYPSGHPQSYIRLSLSHAKLAVLYGRADDPGGAEEQLRKAVESDGVLVREFKAPDALRLYTAPSRGRLGTFLASRGRYADARRELTACAADCERLAGAFPALADYRGALLDCRFELARVAYLEGQPDEAREWMVKTVAVHRTLEDVRATRRPTVELFSVPVAGVLDPHAPLETADARGPLWRAVARLRGGEFGAAEAAFDEVIRTAAPGWQAVGLASYYRAVCQAKRGDKAAARATFAAAESQNWTRLATDASIRVAQREAEAAIAGP